MIIFFHGIQRGHGNDFVWYGSVLYTHKVCFELKIGFPNTLDFNWKLSLLFYIDLHQSPRSASNPWWLDFLTSYVSKKYSSHFDAWHHWCEPNDMIEVLEGWRLIFISCGKHHVCGFKVILGIHVISCILGRESVSSECEIFET